MRRGAEVHHAAALLHYKTSVIETCGIRTERRTWM